MLPPCYYYIIIIIIIIIIIVKTFCLGILIYLNFYFFKLCFKLILALH